MHAELANEPTGGRLTMAKDTLVIRSGDHAAPGRGEKVRSFPSPIFRPPYLALQPEPLTL